MVCECEDWHVCQTGGFIFSSRRAFREEEDYSTLFEHCLRLNSIASRKYIFNHLTLRKLPMKLERKRMISAEVVIKRFVSTIYIIIYYCANLSYGDWIIPSMIQLKICSLYVMVVDFGLCLT
jgi:hypothetical protein